MNDLTNDLAREASQHSPEDEHNDFAAQGTEGRNAGRWAQSFKDKSMADGLVQGGVNATALRDLYQLMGGFFTATPEQLTAPAQVASTFRNGNFDLPSLFTGFFGGRDYDVFDGGYLFAGNHLKTMQSGGPILFTGGPDFDPGKDVVTASGLEKLDLRLSGGGDTKHGFGWFDLAGGDWKGMDDNWPQSVGMMGGGAYFGYFGGFDLVSIDGRVRLADRLCRNPWHRTLSDNAA
jgi:hypothetical protein